jgi:hypothetical protein
MKKQRTHLAATKIRWIVVLLVACFGQDAVALPAGPDRMDEVYYYQEVTGTSVKKVAWELNKGGRYTLTYTSPKVWNSLNRMVG